MKTSTRLILLMILILVLISVAYFLREQVFSNLVQPIALIFWEVWRLLRSINQNVVWAFLILLTTIILSTTITKGMHLQIESAYANTNPVKSRIDYWKDKLILFSNQNNSSTHMRSELLKLWHDYQNQSYHPESTFFHEPKGFNGFNKPEHDSTHKNSSPPQLTNGQRLSKTSWVEWMPVLIKKCFSKAYTKTMIKSNLKLIEWIECEMEIKNESAKKL